MLTTVVIAVDRVYGKKVAYPVSTNAKLLAGLAGSTTLTPSAIRSIIALGYDIEIEIKPDCNIAFDPSMLNMKGD